MKQWLAVIETSVLAMAVLRMVSGSIEVCAALVMLYLNDVKKALVVNSLLAFVGPTVLIVTMTIGVLSISNDISFLKLFFLFLGVGCILIAVFK
ncbi:YqhV family protein [Bacillus sp. 165]|uniref:YqhV family protein n=1 Tax=Bacillus sp. 165 TaxID=1529117 RepID=UPI001AD9FD9D|nr:YqhV family protein [Bacillus sp. 165]MBO9129698.1 YqhV family protein [Bacillus sp. 165]